MNLSGDNILLVSCNPDPVCISVEISLVRSLRNHSFVSACNINQVINCVSLANTPRDRLYERVDRKYSRFIVPEINGADLTGILDTSFTAKIPHVPAEINDVRNYKLQGISIGLAALSTAANSSKCTSSFSSDYGTSLKHAWRIAHLSFYVGLRLSQLNFKNVFIFNGRHAISRPISEVLAKASTIFSYETSPSRQKYFYFDKPIHDPLVLANYIILNASNRSTASKFFLDSINRNSSSISTQFTSHQRVGLLPEGLGDHDVISFFTSSSDEYFAIRDDARLSNDFPGQFDVAYFSAVRCRNIGKKFVIRMHPNLDSKHHSWRDEWDFHLLESLGAIVLYPADSCDSYSLLLRSSAVITCGSTIGIEAAYHGVPSAVVGDFLSGRIGCASNTSSAEDLALFIRAPFVLQHSKERALCYGSFAKSEMGIDIVGLTMVSGDYYFEGRLLSPSRFFLSKVKILLNYVASFLFMFRRAEGLR